VSARPGDYAVSGCCPSADPGGHTAQPRWVVGGGNGFLIPAELPPHVPDGVDQRASLNAATRRWRRTVRWLGTQFLGPGSRSYRRTIRNRRSCTVQLGQRHPPEVWRL